jgi:hypothetical protein
VYQGGANVVSNRPARHRAGVEGEERRQSLEQRLRAPRGFELIDRVRAVWRHRAQHRHLRAEIVEEPEDVEVEAGFDRPPPAGASRS